MQLSINHIYLSYHIFIFKILSTITHFEIKGVIGVRHQVIFISALQLEAMCDSPF